MVQQRAASAPLGIAGDLPSAQHQIRSPGDSQPRNIERLDDGAKDELEAGGDIGQLGMRRERQDDCVVQTARAEHDGAAAGDARSTRTSSASAVLLDHVVGDTAMTSEDDDRPRRVPDSATGSGRGGVNGLKHGPVERQLFLSDRGWIPRRSDASWCRSFSTGDGAPPPSRTNADASLRIRLSSAQHGRRRLKCRSISIAPRRRRWIRGSAPGCCSILDDDFGNAGSRTHEWGRRARTAVEHARDSVAAVVASSRGDVIFTSGATESNNLAILGLAAAAGDRRHIVSTAIEHHAVLEPLEELGRRGFEVTLGRSRPGRRG